MTFIRLLTAGTTNPRTFVPPLIYPGSSSRDDNNNGRSGSGLGFGLDDAIDAAVGNGSVHSGGNGSRTNSFRSSKGSSFRLGSTKPRFEEIESHRYYVTPNIHDKRISPPVPTHHPANSADYIVDMSPEIGVHRLGSPGGKSSSSIFNNNIDVHQRAMTALGIRRSQGGSPSGVVPSSKNGSDPRGGSLSRLGPAGSRSFTYGSTAIDQSLSFSSSFTSSMSHLGTSVSQSHISPSLRDRKSLSKTRSFSITSPAVDVLVPSPSKARARTSSNYL